GPPDRSGAHLSHGGDAGKARKGARDPCAGLFPATEAPPTQTTEVAMDDRGGGRPKRGPWSTKKRVTAPRGVYRHPRGDWGVRYTCGAGHIHKERVGRVKQDAKDVCDERRLRAKAQPDWCPLIQRRHSREQATEARRRELARVTFRDHVRDF